MEKPEGPAKRHLDLSDAFNPTADWLAVGPVSDMPAVWSYHVYSGKPELFRVIAASREFVWVVEEEAYLRHTRTVAAGDKDKSCHARGLPHDRIYATQAQALAAGWSTAEARLKEHVSDFMETVKFVREALQTSVPQARVKEFVRDFGA